MKKLIAFIFMLLFFISYSDKIEGNTNKEYIEGNTNKEYNGSPVIVKECLIDKFVAKKLSVYKKVKNDWVKINLITSVDELNSGSTERAIVLENLINENNEYKVCLVWESKTKAKKQEYYFNSFEKVQAFLHFLFQWIRGPRI